MKLPIPLAIILLIAFAEFSHADDHLFNAEEHGLAPDGNAINHTHAFTTNSAGNSGDLAPGQGSPFTGDDMQTPSSEVAAEQPHANIKERDPK